MAGDSPHWAQHKQRPANSAAPALTTFAISPVTDGGRVERGSLTLSMRTSTSQALTGSSFKFTTPRCSAEPSMFQGANHRPVMLAGSGSPIDPGAEQLAIVIVAVRDEPP